MLWYSTERSTLLLLLLFSTHIVLFSLYIHLSIHPPLPTTQNVIFLFCLLVMMMIMMIMLPSLRCSCFLYLNISSSHTHTHMKRYRHKSDVFSLYAFIYHPVSLISYYYHLSLPFPTSLYYYHKKLLLFFFLSHLISLFFSSSSSIIIMIILNISIAREHHGHTTTIHPSSSRFSRVQNHHYHLSMYLSLQSNKETLLLCCLPLLSCVSKMCVLFL